jgi:hypothetical protein
VNSILKKILYLHERAIIILNRFVGIGFSEQLARNTCENSNVLAVIFKRIIANESGCTE